MLLSFEYTFPGGLPRMRLHRASLAILMFWKLPKMRMCWSAMTMRVRVADGELGLARLPRQAPERRGSCARPSASASLLHLEALQVQIVEAEKRHRVVHLEPEQERLHEIRALLQRPSSSVSFVVLSSTFFVLRFMRRSIFICFVTGSYRAIQFSFRGVNRFAGTFTCR